MPTICMHCALEAFVEGRVYAGDDETPTEHMKRVHPGGVDPFRRRELELLAEKKLKEQQGR